MITLENPKVVALLRDKEVIVNEARGCSKELEKLEKQIAKHDDKERAITASVNPTALIEQGNAIQQELEAKLKELEQIGNQIMETKLAAIPKAMLAKHKKLRDTKKTLEEQRSKLAIKAQKIKDKVVPILKKELAGKLAEFEDIEGAKVVGDKVQIETFNMLTEFEAKLRAKITQ